MASYSRLNPEDITVSTDKVTANAWSDDTDTLSTFFTSLLMILIFFFLLCVVWFVIPFDIVSVN